LGKIFIQFLPAIGPRGPNPIRARIGAIRNVQEATMDASRLLVKNADVLRNGVLLAIASLTDMWSNEEDFSLCEIISVGVL
jgi:hypothetical protein